MTDTLDTLRDLPAKYANPDPSLVSTLPKGGVKLDFVGHADITLQLIDADPGWWWEPLAVDEDGAPKIIRREKVLVMWGKLHLLGTTTIEVGSCELTKTDVDKELIGDFLRRAAMRRGFATKLWSKTDREAGLAQVAQAVIEPEVVESVPAGWFTKDSPEWQAVSDRLKALGPTGKDIVLTKAIEAGLFRNEVNGRFPNLPFSPEQLATMQRLAALETEPEPPAMGHSAHADALLLDVLGIERKEDFERIEDWQWDLAEYEDPDAIDWKVTAKAMGLRPKDLLDEARAINAKLGGDVDELKRLDGDAIRGEVAKALRIWALTSSEPF